MKQNFQSKILWVAVCGSLAFFLVGALIYKNIVDERRAKVDEVLVARTEKLKSDCNAVLIVYTIKLYISDNSTICRQYAQASGDEFYLRIADLLQQYEIAKRTENYADACIHAGVIAAIFLKEKNEHVYNAWKKTQAEDCRRAILR